MSKVSFAKYDQTSKEKGHKQQYEPKPNKNLKMKNKGWFSEGKFILKIGGKKASPWIEDIFYC